MSKESKTPAWWNAAKPYFGLALVGVSITITVHFLILVSDGKDLSSQENIFFAFFMQILSIWGSIVFGGAQAKKKLETTHGKLIELENRFDSIKAHSHSAVKRSIRSFEGFTRILEILTKSNAQRERNSNQTKRLLEDTCLRVDEAAKSAILGAEDAISDWRVIDPEGIQEIVDEYIEDKNIKRRDDAAESD